MTMTPSPAIFISAVSKELRTSRELVSKTLQFLGYTPVWQDVFGTEQGDVRAMLRQKIDGCQGVVQLVGKCYGFEPPESDQHFGRVSYTQYEALYAKQRGKKVWYLFLDDGFPVDAHEAEPEDARKLQADYRRHLESQPDLYHLVENRAALETHVLKLRDELTRLRRNVKQWAAAVLGLLLILVAGGIWGTYRIGQLNANLEQLMSRGAPPEPMAAAPGAAPVAAAGNYAAPAYAASAVTVPAGAAVHPKLALAVFGLGQGATRWMPLGPETSLRSGEHFFVRAETFTPGFLYIFEVDSSGNLQWLFPANPTLTYSTGANPVPARVAVTIPPGENQAYALDDTVGEERLYAVFSATRWEQLETVLKAAGTSPTDATRREIETLLAADDAVEDRAKGIARVEDAAVAKEVRQAVGPGDEPRQVDLPAHSVEANGYWLMEVRRFRHLARAAAAGT
jgi:hypothetical protein